MAGLGLMNRRRGIQASPTTTEIDTSGYVQDSILMWLDGIEKGGEAGVWKDKKGVNNFVSVGAIELDNGWEFDGASSYMKCEGGTNYTASNSRTIEIVYESFGAPKTVEILFIGNSGGYAFTRWKDYFAMGTNNDFPTYANPIGMGAAKIVYGKGASSILNGATTAYKGNGSIKGGIATLFLGNRNALDYPFHGIIHSLRIHGRALTQEEILQNQQLDNIRFKLGIEALNPTE